MIRIELHTVLDREALEEILELIEATTRIEGHRPVSEHKYAHLRVGAEGWIGVLAYDRQRLVGYAHTRWNGVSERPRVAVEVVVHPDYHGRHVARRLLDEARSVLARAGGGLLYLWVHRVEDAASTLAARLGFQVQRELAFMSRDLPAAPDPPTPPEGIRLRPYRPDVDDEEFLRVNNAAFAGHPENGGWDRRELLERRRLDWFDPAGLIMAWRGDELVGFHWTKWHGHDADGLPVHDPVGEVYVLAVHPGAQRLGLGRVLLAAGLRHLHRRGCRRVVLYVDCSSAAALALYRAAGFALVCKDVCYQDWVEPVVDQPASDLLRPA
ncbi:MAG TPA: mycothiol synthase [Egibacteraceae bacterium]|nr:mycothiol synthase [Egibacteraceae bacterium]